MERMVVRSGTDRWSVPQLDMYALSNCMPIHHTVCVLTARRRRITRRRGSVVRSRIGWDAYVLVCCVTE